jgi:hypothetical protein
VWEYRLVWPRAKPPGWESAWQRGLTTLKAQGREIEKRPDTYLVLRGRLDAGLKLRGGGEDDFDVKVRHSRDGGWELWEKVAFLRWNALEAVRLTALLRVASPEGGHLEDATPGAGAQALLEAAGVARTRVIVRKERMQAAARELMAGWPGSATDLGWLAELVEITLPGRSQPVYSLCLEGLEPPPGAPDPLPLDGGLACGYPELLLGHLAGSI